MSKAYTTGHGFTMNHKGCKECELILTTTLKTHGHISLEQYRQKLITEIEGMAEHYIISSTDDSGNNIPYLKKSNVIKLLESK